MIVTQKLLGSGGSVLLLAVLCACSQSSSTTPPPTTRSVNTTEPPATSQTPTRTPPGRSPSIPQSNPPATEFNPPGDIPDNQVFVDYQTPGSTVHVKVPEGWARATSAGVTTFTDNYNSIAIQVMNSAAAPTITSAQQIDVPRLRQTVPSFAPGRVSMLQRQHGTAILITYFADSAPSPVTGKVVRDAVQRYEFWRSGEEAVLTLTGPKGADNVDPWQLVSDSLQWR